jgi:predicted nucleotidyltransferase
MKKIIQERLLDIQKEKNIKILFSSESGSRGWGFPSPDSDYDVRFFYVRSKNEYLSISEGKDQYDFPINDLLDINGWDIRKALRLMMKSNASPLEWLQSPIIYMEEPGIREEIFELAKQYFIPRATAHHYLGISKNLLEQGIVGEEFKIKKYFYVLRSLLSAKWIIDKNEIAPMEFHILMQQIQDRTELVDAINILLEKKKIALEGALTSVQPIIHEFVKTEFVRCDKAVKNIERRDHDKTELDVFFRKIIEQYG